MSDEILEKIKAAAGDELIEVAEFRGDQTYVLKPSALLRVAEYARSELAFDLIIDVLGVDMYRPDQRFEVVYIVYSIARKAYLQLKVRIDEDHPEVPSVTGVWPGANWHEREVYDMFGIHFTGHPDLRRLYMPEEFEYYPLRKDFPLMGVPDSLPLPRR
jgi:NADH-quinone oxidoreductase subunit C